MDIYSFFMWQAFLPLLGVCILILFASNSVVNWWRRRNRDWAPALRPSKKQREAARARRERGEEIQ